MMMPKHFKHITLAIFCAAALSACGGGGGGTGNDNTAQLNTTVADASAAQRVNSLISALPEADTITSEQAATSADQGLASAIAAYNKLTANQKRYVSKASTDKMDALTAKLAEFSAIIAANQQEATRVSNLIKALPATAEAIDTPKEEDDLSAAGAAYNALTDAQKALLSATDIAKLNALLANSITDSKPLPALNLPTPLHTDFISSATAQQNNPNVQLRSIDGKAGFTYDQGGVISTLASNKNASVPLDGVTINNTTTAGNATEVSFATPNSAIIKAFSGGNSQEDISAQTGQDPNSVFAPVKTTLDATIAASYQAMTAAKTTRDAALETLNKATADNKAAAQTAYDKAEAEFVKRQTKYDTERAARQALENNAMAAVNQLAYFKKDRNGLVFDKKLDGVYVVQFADGTRIVLHDSAAAGWTYQTFAHYVDPKNGVIHGYQSLGEETGGTAMPTTGTATYKGISTAYLVNNGSNSQLSANVEAIADFAQRQLNFKTNNSHIHTLNAGVRTSTAADGYNLKGNASWAANNNQFNGNVANRDKTLEGKLNGKFYGGQAAEIGGTYSLSNQAGTTQLIGGYGAKRD